MRQSTLLLSTSLLALGFGLVAHAATSAPTPLSDFHVSSVVPADEALKPYCAMANRFGNGLIITHSRNNFGLGSISFDFPDIDFDQGKNYQITVNVGSLTRRYAAIAAKTNLLIAKTGRDDILFDALDKGTPIQVELENGALSYQLISDQKAFAEFDDCLAGLEQAPLTSVKKETAIVSEPIPVAPVVPSQQNIIEKSNTIKESVLATDKLPKIETAKTVTEDNQPLSIAEEAVTQDIAPVKEALGSLTEKPDYVIERAVTKEEIIPLSDPISPAQIALEKTTRRHSIKASDLLFDDPEAAKLAVPNALAENKVVALPPRQEPFPILDDIEETKEAPAIEKMPSLEQEAPVRVVSKIEEASIDTPEQIKNLEKEMEEAHPLPSKTYTREAVLPTGRLVDTPTQKKLVSPPVVQARQPEAIKTQEKVAVLPATKLEIPETKKELVQPIPPVKEIKETPVIEEVNKVETPKIEPEKPLIVEPKVAPAPVYQPKVFTPPPAAPLQNWTVKNIAATNDLPSYCLISNRFENGMGVYATRSPDGNSTLGLDFGFDVLEQDRLYKVSVEIDHLFSDSFTAQASDEVMMVVQMGQQDAFFNALRTGQALHISMPGAASTFALDNLTPSYQQFKQCLKLQNGTAIVETQKPLPTSPVIPTAPVVIEEVTSVPITAEEPTKVTRKEDILPKNSLPEVKEKQLSSPAMVQTSMGVNEKPSQQTETFNPVKLNDFSKTFVAPTEGSNDNLSVDSILTASGIGHTAIRLDDENENILHWSLKQENISGTLVETPWVSQASLLDRLMDDIDTMEQICVGEFTSQIGIPATFGKNIIAHAETKCSTDGKATNAAHIYQGSGNTIKVWTLAGPSDLSRDIISSRNKISGILRQRATANTTN